MARSADLSALTGLSTRFGTFVAERFPLALAGSARRARNGDANGRPRDGSGVD